MARYKLTIEYDGTSLAGWQRQLEHPSVQAHLEKALFAYTQTEITAICAGRTDAGVHALGQVVHVDIARNDSAFTVMQALNHHLRYAPLVIRKAEQVDDAFHARFDAVARHYRYLILNRRAPSVLHQHRMWHVPRELDSDAMHLAGQHLQGTYDFSSFRASECQAKSPVKTLDTLRIYRSSADVIVMDVSARSFLHHQVRNIIGTLMLVGLGKWSEADLITARDAACRSRGGITAPAHGLYFMQVDYGKKQALAPVCNLQV